MTTLTTDQGLLADTDMPPDNRRPIPQRVLPFVVPHRVVLARTLAAALTKHGLVVVVGGLGAHLVAQAASGARVSELLPGLVALGVAVIGRAVALWAESWFTHDLAYRILAELRVTFYSRLERLAPRYLLGRRTGDLAGTVMSDIEQFEYFFAHMVAASFCAVVIPLAAVFGLAFVAPVAALVLVPFLLAAASVPLWLSARAGRQGQVMRDHLGGLNADVVDGVQGLRELTLFGRGEDQRRRFALSTRRLLGLQLRYGSRQGLERVASDATVALGTVAVLAVTANAVADGSLAATTYPVVVVVAFSAFAPILEVTQTCQLLGVVRAAARRYFAVIDAPPTVVDLVDTSPSVPVVPSIGFDGVSFRYEEGLPLVLDEVGFDVRAGEMVALIGASGAGKTTCANLLLRFWDVTGGAVRIGAHDVRSLRQTALRDLITLVPQDVYLFNTSIEENILLGRPDASDADVREVARLALVSEFVDRLPEGYATTVGERGAELSGGQRQRIAIARALLKDAPVLVMDEAVSNLDTENERALQTLWPRRRRDALPC